MTVLDSQSVLPLQRSWWARLGTGGAVAILALALVGVTAAWAVPQAVAARKPSPWFAAASAALMLALLGALLAVGPVRAMALQTFSQCLRMKVAAVFVALLALSLGVLPFVMTGDGTLAGAIQTLLAYGTSVTLVLLSVVTVLVSVNVVASDVERKRIFLTATKPLARWQYVVGRWLGVVMLDALLLAVAMAAVFVLAQHYRRQPVTMGGEDRGPVLPEDRRAVETQVFTAREKVFPNPENIDRLLEDRVNELGKDGRYAEGVEQWKSRTNGDPVRAEQEFQKELRNQIVGERSSTGLWGAMLWVFHGVRVSGTETVGTGTVEQADFGNERLRVRIDPARASRILAGIPVRINSVDGRAVEVGGNYLVVRFYAGNLSRLGDSAAPGRTVSVTVDPSIQVCYKATVSTDLPGDVLEGDWSVWNPVTNAFHLEKNRKDPVGRPATLTVSGRAVDANGWVVVEFHNLSNTSVTIAPEDIFILYAAGRFEWNYLRAVLLMLLHLAFLAAIGVLAGAFLSFPVGVLLCGVILGFSLARPFLANATEVTSIFSEGVDPLSAAGFLAVQFLGFLLPDLMSTWPSDNLVDGLRISWTFLGQTAATTMGVRGLLALALGCLIFHKRELARVQV